MLDAGLKATINSDDPAYFGGYLGDNIDRVAAALGLGDTDLVHLLRNSLDACFAPEAWKETALADFDDKAG